MVSYDPDKIPRTRIRLSLSQNYFLFMVLLLSVYLPTCVQASYKVGVGRADMTGPVAGVTLAGYSKIDQTGSGLHLRQFARAFIIEDNSTLIAYVCVDTAFVSDGLRRKVLNELNSQYGNTFNGQNFILSATHTHSTPGGHMMNVLFDYPTLGFVEGTFEAYASGIVRAVSRAYANMQEGKIYYNTGEVLDVNINRSPLSYLLNPESERKRYKYDVEKNITQLSFVSKDNVLMGSLQWYHVHATSMNNSNTLVSTDNLGYASILLEQHFNNGNLIGQGSIPRIACTSNRVNSIIKTTFWQDYTCHHQGPFVSAFDTSYAGDVSPNTKGPHCITTEESCATVTSTCDGDAKECIAFGPGDNIYESTKIIAKALFEKATAMLNDQKGREEVTGPLKVVHRYADMPLQEADYVYPNGTKSKVRGCVPAAGYSLAAGTTDGPGAFDFTQGMVEGTPFWDGVRNLLLVKPTPEDVECQKPKPILIPSGRLNTFYEWQSSIVSLQVAFIGNVAIVPIPAEFTTMSGRRLHDVVENAMTSNTGPGNVKVIISGLCNMYSDYVATPEEYTLQRYEGASTMFGPHTLTIYLKLYKELTDALLKNTDVEDGQPPKDLTDKVISLLPPILFDSTPLGVKFGDCIQQPSPTAKAGDAVIAKFASGHPRNNVMHEKTFLSIEKLTNGNEWVVVATDANWETRFTWERTHGGDSSVTVEWNVRNEVEPGIYKIRHFGNYKNIFQKIFSYEGESKTFEVLRG